MEEMASPFKKYLESIEETRHMFSRKTGIPLSTVYRIYRGKNPRRSLAKKICRLSKGKLTIEDFGYKEKVKTKGESYATQER